MRAPARLAAFLRDPGACRVVLLYGNDVGLVGERAEALTRAVTGSTDDPFRLTELGRDQIIELANEAASLPFTGGRRVVRVRDVTDTDAIRAAVAVLLDGPAPALVVLEAPGLASKAKLKTAIEAAPDGVAIACYPEDRKELDATIAAALAEAGLRAEAEAVGWLAAHLGADRAATRQELNKLALYVGPGGRVDLAAAMESVGDLAGLSLDDALFAATEGAVGQADRALELALAEGGTPVGVLRGGLMHLQRLHRARIAVDAGQSPAEAAKSVRPPVFFRRVDAFARALALWPEPALRAAMSALAEAERGCKRTGAPDYAICRHTIQTLARQAQARSGPGRRRPV